MRGLARSECFVCDWYTFAVNARSICNDLRTCEILANWGVFKNSTSSRVKNQLKIIKVRVRQVQKQRVVIVYLGMNERRSYSLSSCGVQSILIQWRWRIERKQDLDRLFTEAIWSDIDLTYENRLTKLKLPTLKYCRARGDRLKYLRFCMVIMKILITFLFWPMLMLLQGVTNIYCIKVLLSMILESTFSLTQ